jgi:hypothetical protein
LAKLFHAFAKLTKSCSLPGAFETGCDPFFRETPILASDSQLFSVPTNSYPTGKKALPAEKVFGYGQSDAAAPIAVPEAAALSQKWIPAFEAVIQLVLAPGGADASPVWCERRWRSCRHPVAGRDPRCRKPLNSRAVSSILPAPKRPCYGAIDPGLRRDDDPPGCANSPRNWITASFAGKAKEEDAAPAGVRDRPDGAREPVGCQMPNSTCREFPVVKWRYRARAHSGKKTRYP